MSFEQQQPEKLDNDAENKEGMSWVQDVAREEADEKIEKMNIKIKTGEIKSPEGSEYKAGPSKSGNENEVGIYFSDPTASEESDKENPEE